mmetsp:Transcript_14930/g.33321  ORF Transcript_14930/g.33321 Transcript_14930/m.33321 type:complete len:238 (+) Transcript_14930:773-1486(+)
MLSRSLLLIDCSASSVRSNVINSCFAVIRLSLCSLVSCVDLLNSSSRLSPILCIFSELFLIVFISLSSSRLRVCNACHSECTRSNFSLASLKAVRISSSSLSISSFCDFAIRSSSAFCETKDFIFLFRCSLRFLSSASASSDAFTRSTAFFLSFSIFTSSLSRAATISPSCVFVNPSSVFRLAISNSARSATLPFAASFFLASLSRLDKIISFLSNSSRASRNFATSTSSLDLSVVT